MLVSIYLAALFLILHSEELTGTHIKDPVELSLVIYTVTSPDTVRRKVGNFRYQLPCPKSTLVALHSMKLPLSLRSTGVLQKITFDRYVSLNEIEQRLVPKM